MEVAEMRMNDWGAARCISELAAEGGRVYVYLGGLFSWYVANVRKM